MGAIRVGIVGCGNIAGPYAKDIQSYAHLELSGVFDSSQERMQSFAAEHHCRACGSLPELFKESDLIVNLTSHHAHYEISTQCLEAGKHVYSEKPLAMTYLQAAELLTIAEKRGVRLGCSPFTLMGEAQQTAWKLIREGKAGTIRAVYAEVNWGRIESWHPAPEGFYDVGPLFDVGVYPLTILVSMFGPARQVLSYGRVLHPERKTKEGRSFQVHTPDFVVSLIELAEGPVVRLTTNFYVGHHNHQTGIEFHGDLGSVYLESWQNFNSKVEFAPFGGQYEAVPLVKNPAEGTPWGRGVAEMAEAIQQNRPHRFSGELAAHVTEILGAAARSVIRLSPVAVSSAFSAPTPMEWAL